MNTSYIKTQLLKLSRNNPQLSYDYNLSNYLAKSEFDTKELLDVYFNKQPKDYVSELSDFALINNNEISAEKIFCFVCCYNETSNIHNLIKNYSKQITSVEFEVCFIINFEVDKNSFQNDYDNFINTLDILIEYKKKYNWINIITKQFSNNNSGLGRARKYGMDYCLYRLKQLSNKQINNSIIISNEGDTLFINDDYFNEFYQENIKNKNCLIQGDIDYPKFIKENHNLVLDYITFKEKIHLGLGLNYSKISAFGGIMPIGRNYSIHPNVAVKIGSIDPKYHKGTDDDINMGLDITYKIDVNCKIHRPIPLITNPRREVILIMEHLQGKWGNGKEMYECFHKVKYIYDYDIYNIKAINDKIDFNINLKDINSVIQDLFLWVFRNIAKSELINERFVMQTIKKHMHHDINYWQMENELMKFIILYISQNPAVKLKIINTSISFFYDFTDILLDQNLLSFNNKSYKLEYSF